MPLSAILLPLLAAVAPADTRPITVTGHAWAPFISPMGEPYRAHSATDDTLAIWFARADANHDGSLTVSEMQTDADRFFAVLDSNHDGEIDPTEIAYYEWEVAPDIQVMSKTRQAPGQKLSDQRSSAPPSPGPPRGKRLREEEDSQLGIAGGLQGAARYGLLNIPEPVAAADTDFNRGVSQTEFRQAAIARFQLLDRGHQDRLTLAELQGVRTALLTGRPSKRDSRAVDERVGNRLPGGD